MTDKRLVLQEIQARCQVLMQRDIVILRAGEIYWLDWEIDQVAHMFVLCFRFAHSYTILLIYIILICIAKIPALTTQVPLEKRERERNRRLIVSVKLSSIYI